MITGSPTGVFLPAPRLNFDVWFCRKKQGQQNDVDNGVDHIKANTGAQVAGGIAASRWWGFCWAWLCIRARSVIRWALMAPVCRSIRISSREGTRLYSPKTLQSTLANFVHHPVHMQAVDSPKR